MAWMFPDQWQGVDATGFVRFKGLDVNSSFVAYKTAPMSQAVASGWKKLSIGGESVYVYFFCSGEPLFSVFRDVIYNHPDAHKDYEWKLTGPTWLNTNKIFLVKNLKGLMQQVDAELGKRYCSARLEVRPMEMVDAETSTRHIAICMRPWGRDFEPWRYQASAEAHAELVSRRAPSWLDMLDVVHKYFSPFLPRWGVSEPSGPPSNFSTTISACTVYPYHNIPASNHDSARTNHSNASSSAVYPTLTPYATHHQQPAAPQVPQVHYY